MGSILALNHKFFMLPKVDARPKVFFRLVFVFFSALCDLFFENFRILSKGNPLHFFEVFGL